MQVRQEEQKKEREKEVKNPFNKINVQSFLKSKLKFGFQNFLRFHPFHFDMQSILRLPVKK